MESYFTNNKKTLCSGCRCCQHVCPVEAITMENDKEGFLHPIKNKEKCINCGLCEKRCPYVSNVYPTEHLEKPFVFAVSHNNQTTLKKSSSGGMFSALAELVLEKGGAIVGCAFDNYLNPIHTIAEDDKNLVKMRGSKYIQSDTRTTFKETEIMLKQGRWVLYTGTPCQIAGLKSYLNVRYEKLITVDLICHGTPSNELFQAYLKWLESKLKGKITAYRFRDKSKYGWASVGSITYEKNGKSYVKLLAPDNDYFYHLYVLNGNIYRECCYTCKYATLKREGDFTIGDYWNIQQFHSELYPPNGVSVVLVNTDKAVKIFSEIEKKVIAIQSDVENVIKSNGNLSKPSERPSSRDSIYMDVEKLGFGTAAKKYCKTNKLSPKLKRAIPYDVKAKIKKFMGKS